MKKFLMLVASCIALAFSINYLYYYAGNLYWPAKGPVTCISKSDQNSLYIKTGKEFEKINIRGVNMGFGKPGYFASEDAITKEEYLRWFHQIQEMGANMIRIYTMASPDFYEAFYEYNTNNPKPLYLIHGVWVDEYLLNSSYSAFDEEFYDPFLDACKDTVDLIHGRYKKRGYNTLQPENYRWDISQWVYGYLWGTEWTTELVAFTNDCLPQAEQFEGKYLHTENASNFEIFLASIGNEVIEYETVKYAAQHAISFTNWFVTSPLRFSDKIEYVNKKYEYIDMDHVKISEDFTGAIFASYHIYPYSPEEITMEDNYYEKNAYLEYLKRLNMHHNIPVVIAEFGVPTSRGMASYEQNRNIARDQGQMNEIDQGRAVVSMYRDIMKAGSAGGMVFCWQDEWRKQSWNTISTVNLENTVYWSDVQTNTQHFGLLSFEPGRTERNCRIDGVAEEWSQNDVVYQDEGFSLSAKYDLEGMYFLIEKSGLDLKKDKIYIPIDVTPKSGSTKVSNLNVEVSEPADFLVELRGRENSRVWVQSRYDAFAALYGTQAYNVNSFFKAPSADSSIFRPIHSLLQEIDFYLIDGINLVQGRPTIKQKIDFKELELNLFESFLGLNQHYETGRLRYGNGNPKVRHYDSLADFCAGKDCVELRIPWQLLNFADPSQMKIHDDYYECYGVEYLRIDHINVGVGDGSKTINMIPFELTPLGKKPEYHERLKRSYYILKDYWTKTA